MFLTSGLARESLSSAQFSSVLSRADGVPARGDFVVVVDPDTDRVKVHWTGTIHPRTACISLFALFGVLAWSQQSETWGVRPASGSGSVAGDVVIEGTCLPVHFAEICLIPTPGESP
jgi:hypothetical protein